MTMNLHETMQQVIDGKLQLPASSYNNAQYHEHEIKAIYENSWTAIGFASDFIKPAQAVEILNHPLLITRDNQNTLHVFANVCRHRGHLLLQEEQEIGRLITCPYHAWCYGLDGKFVKAPYWDGNYNSEPTESQKSELALLSIRFNVWYDIIFVNLSGQAEPFEEYIAGLDKRWNSFRSQSALQCFSKKSYSIAGNWKLAAENFLDNYHLPWIHPQIGSSTEAALGLDVEEIKISDNILGFSHPTAGKDKDKIEKPLPGWPGMKQRDQARQDLFFVFPNTCLVMEGYYLWSMILLPTAVDHCDEKLALYVVGEGGMRDDLSQSRRALADVIYKINDQDSDVIKNLQAGRKGDAAGKGIYNQRHDQLGKLFHQTVAKKIGSTL